MTPSPHALAAAATWATFTGVVQSLNADQLDLGGIRLTMPHVRPTPTLGDDPGAIQVGARVIVHAVCREEQWLVNQLNVLPWPAQPSAVQHSPATVAPQLENKTLAAPTAWPTGGVKPKHSFSKRKGRPTAQRASHAESHHSAQSPPRG